MDIYAINLYTFVCAYQDVSDAVYYLCRHKVCPFGIYANGYIGCADLKLSGIYDISRNKRCLFTKFCVKASLKSVNFIITYTAVL